jgi:PleD family two-component response regulator
VALYEPSAGTVSAHDLVVAADGAMYRSKSEGRDRNSVVRT